jgi:outer membrane beta-barrel protein
MTKSVAAILIVMMAHLQATAFPQDGTLKELGEAPINDQIKGPANGASAPAVSAEVPPASESLSAYGKLDAFDEMAILQRKYLPKAQRLELGLSYGFLADNAFFDIQTVYGRLAYAFTEAWAAEVSGFSANTEDSRAAKSLYENGGVSTDFAAVPRSYLGIGARWSPIYGKLALWNHTIIPVEQFFLLGGGTTDLDGASDALTTQIGTGYTFGIRKWLSVRVELDVFSYSTSDGDRFNDIHLHFGLGTFFPGAKYR